MNTKDLYRLAFLPLAGCWFAVNGMYAQDANEGSPEETFELSPFVVEEDSDMGYMATQTLAGTRIKSNLRDVATTVQVLTREMMEDTGSTNINELMLYATNGEAGGNGGNFTGVNVSGDDIGADAQARAEPQTNLRIRGLGTPNLSRNYFITDIGFDSYNTQRMEVNRGANAILFGLGSPAGIVNNTLIRPMFKDSGKAVLRVGEYGSLRASLDLNEEIVEDRFAVRVAALHDHEGYKQRPAYEEDERFFITGTWKIDDRTNFKFNAEKGDMHANRPSVIAPTDWISGWLLAGKPIHDTRYYGMVGGGAERNPDGTEYTGTPEGIILDLGLGTVVNSSDAVANMQFSPPGFFEGGVANVYTQPTLRNPDASIAMVRENAFPLVDGLVHPLLPEGSTPETYWYRNTTGLRNMYGGPSPLVDHQGLNTTEFFDWVNQMIGGDTAFQYQEFDAYNVSIDRTFLEENNLGIEFVYDHQDYRMDAFTPFQDRWSGISVDVNPYLPVTETGLLQPNPNFMRPYVFSRYNNRRIRESTRDAYRMTGFYELDIASKVESKWLSWLGRHNLTALLNRQEIETTTYQEELYHTNEFFARNSGQVLGTGFHTMSNHLVYIGDAISPSVTSLNDISIQALDGVKIWDTERSYDTLVWDAGTQPGTETIIADGGTSAGAQAIMDMAGDDGYGNIRTVTEQTGAYVQKPFKSFRTIDTKALNLQSFLFNGNIVANYGWREDTLESQRSSSDDFRTESETFDLDLVNVHDIEKKEVTLSTATWGVVGYLPVKLPLDSVLSVHYAESENFDPEFGRIDVLGNALPNPSGDTKEYGFVLSMLDKKLTLRANWFETNMKNQSTWMNTGQALNLWSQRIGAYYSGVIRNESSSIPTKAATAPLMQAAADAMVASIPEGVMDLYNIRNTYDELGRVTNVIYNSPAGVSDTEDLSSEGFEVELVYNPTKNWRIALNVGQQETVSTNTRPVSLMLAEMLQGTLDTEVPGYDGLRIGEMPNWSFNAWKPEEEGRARFAPGSWLPPTMDMWAEDNVMSKIRSSLAMQGTQTPEQREWRSTLVTNYKFTDGRLKGVALGGAWRWESAAIIDYPFVANELGDMVADVENPFRNDELNNVDLWVSYWRKLKWKNVTWHIQLNVRNVFASENDFVPVSYHSGGPLKGMVSRVRYAPQRTFFVTNTFSF